MCGNPEKQLKHYFNFTLLRLKFCLILSKLKLQYKIKSRLYNNNFNQFLAALMLSLKKKLYIERFKTHRVRDQVSKITMTKIRNQRCQISKPSISIQNIR